MIVTLAMLLAAQATTPPPAAPPPAASPADAAAPVPVPVPATPLAPLSGEPEQVEEAAQRGSGGGSGSGGDVVVTARRRSEQVQNVPIPISVVGVKELDETGSFNIARLQQLQPTLQFYSTNPRNTSVNIRGLGAPLGLTNDGIDQGVGIYVDQVYLSRVAAATLDFLDVQQIETLRGPQGTLYGKNTVAGAINITSKPPSFTFEGRAEVTAGNLSFQQAKASISGPLAETVAVRLGVAATSRRGTVYNVATGNYVNELDNIGLRGALLWKAGADISFTLSGDYNRQDPECCAQIFVRVGSTQRPVGRQFDELARAQGYEPPSRNAFDRLTDLDADLNARNTQGGLSLRGEYQLGAGTLTSVTAWRFWDWLPANDRDFTGLPITTLSQNPTTQDQYTQEFRYAGEGRGFNYVLGVFAFYQDVHTTGTQRQGPAASRWLINPSNTLSADPTVLDGLTASNDIRLENFSGAVFGKLNWDVSDTVTISPGVRLNYDDKVGSYVSVVRDAAGNLVPYSGGTPRQQAQRDAIQPQAFEDEAFREWNVSYDITASYKPARDILVYATYAHSFKSGGLNLNGVPVVNGVVQTQLAQIAPEKVDHFEFGTKSQFLDRRVTLNITGFWTEIRDYQAIVNNQSTSTLRGYLANAGKVRVRGVEADVSARPSERLNLYLNSAITDHEYVDFRNAPCPPELSGGPAAPIGSPGGPAGVPGAQSPVFCDISGQWLPGISKAAFSYGGEYNLPGRIWGEDGQAYLGIDASSRTKFSSNASRSVYTDIDGYTLVNLRAGFRTGGGVNVFGWVRNAFDNEYYEVLATTPGNTGLIAGNVGDPRTYGLTIGAAF